MKIANISWIAVLSLTTLFLPQFCLGNDKWVDAEKQIKRLAPGNITVLPESVVSLLEKENCSIPQARFSKNVISGHFANKTQTDWAVLCSANGKSSILVIWGGKIKCDNRLAASEDRNYLQEVGNGVIAYSRNISVASPERTKNGLDAIEDSFEESGSTIWFCRKGKWERKIASD